MKTIKSNFIERNKNKFFQILKVLFALELIVYFGILVFAVSISVNRGQIQQNIKDEQINVVTLEKNFYDLRKDVVSQSKISLDNNFLDDKKVASLVEYVYVDKVAETASR